MKNNKSKLVISTAIISAGYSHSPHGDHMWCFGLNNEGYMLIAPNRNEGSENVFTVAFFGEDAPYFKFTSLVCGFGNVTIMVNYEEDTKKILRIIGLTSQWNTNEHTATAAFSNIQITVATRIGEAMRHLESISKNAA